MQTPVTREKNLDVLAVGDLNLDIITSPIRQLPEPETSFTVNSMGLFTGGNAANFSAAAASLGLRTVFSGSLGRDAISDWLQDEMRGYGVQLAIKVRPASTAGITFAVTYLDGRRQFIATHGSNLELGYDDVDLSLLERARHVHRSGFWYCPQLMGESTRRLLEVARMGGAQTSLDIGWDSQGWPDHRVNLARQALEETDVLFVNERELQRLTQTELADDGVDRALQFGVRMVALHLGERGSMVVTAKERVIAPAFRVTPVNPTGSGDVYNAAFVYGMLHDWSLQQAALFANAAAAMHILRTKPIYPTTLNVEEFMTKTEVRS